MADEKFYNGDETQFDNGQAFNQNPFEENNESVAAQQPKKSHTGLKTAAASVVGIALGSVGTYAAMRYIDKPGEGEVKQPEGPGPEIHTGNIPQAHNVNDDMSFSDAFAAARAEVGPGGVFVWHGQIYTTHTAEEWAALTPEEQAAFQHELGLTPIDTNHVAQNPEVQQGEGDQNQVADNTGGENGENGENGQGDVADNGEHRPQSGMIDPENPAGGEPGNDVVDEPGLPSLDPNDMVVIGGVEIDGMTYVGALTEDKEIVLVDVDQDEKFDLVLTDLNNDGEIQDNEIFDISDQNFTYDDLAQATFVDYDEPAVEEDVLAVEDTVTEDYIAEDYSVNDSTDDLAYDVNLDM